VSEVYLLVLLSHNPDLAVLSNSIVGSLFNVPNSGGRDVANVKDFSSPV